MLDGRGVIAHRQPQGAMRKNEVEMIAILYSLFLEVDPPSLQSNHFFCHRHAERGKGWLW